MNKIIGFGLALLISVAPAFADNISDLKNALQKMDETIPAVLEATNKLTDDEIYAISLQDFKSDKEKVPMSEVMATVVGYQGLFHDNMKQILEKLEKARK